MSVRMNALILETTKARYLGLGMQIPEIITQRKFVSAICHAYSNAQKLRKTVAPRLLVLDLKFYLKCINLVNTHHLKKIWDCRLIFQTVHNIFIYQLCKNKMF